MSKTLAIGIKIGAFVAGSFIGAFSKSIAQVGSLGKSLELLEKKSRDQTSAGVVDNQRLGASLERLRGQYTALTATHARHEAALEKRSAYRAQLAEMAAIGYGLQRLFRAGAAVEQSEIRLRTVLNTKDVETDIKAARRFARDFASKKLGSETDVLNVQYALNSAGLTAEAARLGSEVVLKVGKITNGLPEQVGEVIATTYNNLGYQLEGGFQERLTRIGELLTKTQFKFQIRDFGQLGESLKMGSTALKQYNIPLAQGVTLLGALNSAGLQGTMAGTSFAATMRNMSKASEEFGFDLQKNKDGQLDVIATLEAMSDAIGGLDEIDQQTNDRLQRVFGEEGVRGVILLGKELTRLRASQEEVSEGSRNIIDKNYDLFLKSTAGQTALLGQKIAREAAKNAKENQGDLFADFASSREASPGTLLPGLNGLLSPLASGAFWLARQAEEYPTLTKYVGGFTLGLLGGTAALIGLGYTSTFIVAGLAKVKATFLLIGLQAQLTALGVTSLSTAWTVFSGALATFAATALPTFTAAFVSLGAVWSGFTGLILANPLGATLAGLALGAGLIYTYWEPLSKFFKGLWDGILKTFKISINWIKTELSIIGKTWDYFVGGFAAEDEEPSKIATRTKYKMGGAITKTALATTMAAAPLGATLNRPTEGRTAEILKNAAPVVQAAAQRAAPVTINSTHGDIVINAAPGQDPEAIARAVKAALAERDRELAWQARARLHDG